MDSSAFGTFFVGKSFPISDLNFQRIDATHWLLDVCATVSPNYPELKEIALYLTKPNLLPVEAALALYIKAGSSEWLYRGCVHAGHPSEVMPLQWPLEPNGTYAPPGPGIVQIGVSVEPLSEAGAKEGSRLGAREDFARLVGLDLYRFMESFAQPAGGRSDTIVVPANILERWLTKFSEKFRRDPDFLTRDKDKI